MSIIRCVVETIKHMNEVRNDKQNGILVCIIINVYNSI